MNPRHSLRAAILISGRGSNMQALIEDCARADSPAEIALVISNKADAGGLAGPARRALPPMSSPIVRFRIGRRSTQKSKPSCAPPESSSSAWRASCASSATNSSPPGATA
jgi:hypothetical protein